MNPNGKSHTHETFRVWDAFKEAHPEARVSSVSANGHILKVAHHGPKVDGKHIRHILLAILHPATETLPCKFGETVKRIRPQDLAWRFEKKEQKSEVYHRPWETSSQWMLANPVTVDKARDRIRQQLRARKPYWNNIITLTLQQVDKEHGREAANKLVEECKLEKYGWRKKPS